MPAALPLAPEAISVHLHNRRPHAPPGQVQGGRAANHPTADDHNVRRAGQLCLLSAGAEMTAPVQAGGEAHWQFPLHLNHRHGQAGRLHKRRIVRPYDRLRNPRRP